MGWDLGNTMLGKEAKEKRQGWSRSAAGKFSVAWRISLSEDLLEFEAVKYQS